MLDPHIPMKLDQLYETDFAVWAVTTAQLLRENRFAEIELDSLIEEVEALSRSDKREIRSRLIKLLSHLLKYAYQPEKRSDSWTATILEQRRQIALILEDSPSLRNYLDEVFPACYTKAKTEAAGEMKRAIALLSEICPFDLENVLVGNWLP